MSLRLDPKFAKAAYASKSGDGELIAFLVAQDLDALWCLDVTIQVLNSIACGTGDVHVCERPHPSCSP
jgi:hypothetical protein